MSGNETIAEPNRVTRLAPSPTGALHLGNARSFVTNWALARQRGWKIVMRVEDLDGPRIKVGAVEQAIEDLTWLGVNWDTPIHTQRADLSPYHEALNHLAHRGMIYPCTCTRKEIEQAQSAPHDDDHELRYPGTCRPESRQPLAHSWPTSLEQAPAYRVYAPPAAVTFHDHIHGEQTIDVDAQVGDFIVATKAGLPAYQLAVVVDDDRQGVTDIVRGDDLLRSTGRQRWLAQLLGLEHEPRYWHLPLVLGPDGKRLAKRHGDTRIAWYRDQQVSPQRILGLIAYWNGWLDTPAPVSIKELPALTDMRRLPRKPATLTDKEHRWLLNT